MKRVAMLAAFAMLVPSLAWAHGGGLDQYGCHNDTKKGDYHCHQGKLKGRSFKSQDTMLAAHPELKSGAEAKKEKAEDKVKDGDKKTTDEHAKEPLEPKKKTSTSKR